MAFGMEIFGKLFLTTFRIVAVALIGWYLYKIVKKGFKTGYIVCVALILTGALGNIIDSVFYGVIFNEPLRMMPFYGIIILPSNSARRLQDILLMLHVHQARIWISSGVFLMRDLTCVRDRKSTRLNSSHT